MPQPGRPALRPARRLPASREPGRWDWAWGTGLVAAGLGTLALNLTLPWLWLPDGAGGGRAVGRSELLAGGSVPYEKALLQWPIWACMALAALGVVLALLDVPRIARKVPRVTHWRLLAAATCAVAAWVLALIGARWLGFFMARLADTGPTLVRLHAVPYIDLALGLGILGLCLVRLRRGTPHDRMHAWKPSASVLAVSMLALLALPLVPFAVTNEGSGRFHYDELTMASVREGDHHGFVRAPVDLEVARGLVWTTLVAAAVPVAVALGGVASGLLRPLRWLSALPAVACAVPTVLLYLDLPNVYPGARLGYNAVLPVALAAVLALHVRAAWAARAERAPEPGL